MGALPRPTLPPGAPRELNHALHDLHHHAGWPSLRTLARQAGCSHTTVSTAFSSPKLPSWGTLELLVEAMDGDTTTFHQLWLAASEPRVGAPAGADIQLAGRRDELAVVQRHLLTGAGMLLVVGEAGIGKTKLVGTAATLASSETGVTVVAGACVPLSSQIPLLPVADALRAIYRADEGRSLRTALSQCAPYVRGYLSVLVPELDHEEPLALDLGDGWARQRLFAAVETALITMAASGKLSLLLEDLHWADTASCDFLEHLLARPVDIPIVGTWRLDDPAIDRSHVDWFDRLMRLRVETLSLVPLTREETKSQLAILTGLAPASEFLDAIYGRSQGQPLFTEQLAAHADSRMPVPSRLADLLDARLGDLTGPAWSVVRAMGVADRPLASPLLREITDLTSDELIAALHDLDARRLLSRLSTDDAALRHPLLAEAVRRRLVAGEARTQHEAIALALASSTNPEPAEVAYHWQAARDDEQELLWRVRAARVAHARFALRQEANEWLRVLDLWPDGVAEASQPPIRRHEAVSCLLDLSMAIGPQRAEKLAAECLALAPTLPPVEAAHMLYLAGDHYAHSGQRDLGLDLLYRATAILEDTPVGIHHVMALRTLEYALREAGRLHEAGAAASRAVEVSGALGDPRWHRWTLLRRAHYDISEGEIAQGMARARQAVELVVEGPDPRHEAALVSDYTDILLKLGGDVDDLVAAGQKGLDTVAAWDLDTFAVKVIRYNMAQALRRAGRVTRAAALIDSHTEDQPPGDRWRLLHFERARLDMLRGRSTEAVARVDTLRAMPVFGIDELIEISESFVDVDLWTGRQDAAYHQVVRVAREGAPTESARDLGPLLALGARAAGDGPVDVRGARLDALTTLRQSCRLDPFATRSVPSDARAWAATWEAELSRLRDQQTIECWTRAASKWEEDTRPHEAAYCLWRAAELAQATGQGTAATRMLRRATQGAREHVPLSLAIGSTRLTDHGPSAS